MRRPVPPFQETAAARKGVHVHRSGFGGGGARYARRGLTTRNTSQHTHPHMPSATANGATTMQNVESVHRQEVLEAGGGGLEPAPAPPPPQTRKRRSMEYIDWGAAHATSASMEAARTLGW